MRELVPRDLERSGLRVSREIVSHLASDMVQLYDWEHIPERKAMPELAVSLS